MRRTDHRTALEAVRKDGALVRFRRSRFEGTATTLAYVSGLKRRLVACEVLSDDTLLPNGYTICRLEDISSLDVPARTRNFVEKYLRLCGRRRRPVRGIKLSSMRSALEWANGRYPLVTIHREVICADICHIGRVETYGARTFRLYPITPHACFDEDRRTFAYADVTRIDFDGGYERALATVAGLVTPGGNTRSRKATKARRARPSRRKK